MSDLTSKISKVGFEGNYHPFKGADRDLLFEVETGRMVELEPALMQTIENALSIGDMQRAELMLMLAGIRPIKAPLMAPPESVPVRSFSLAVAQKCNLGCTYCYAEEGTFGGKQKSMELEIAKASVDRLLKDIDEGNKITLSFMGGEPLINRRTLHAVTAYAAEQAIKLKVGVAFSITTNATLIRDEDIELFQKYKFTVTVSVDGLNGVNDALRPYISGKGSFAQVSQKLKKLITFPDRNYLVLGRVTVTPSNLRLKETMKGLLALGFDSLKFSPMLKSPTGKEQMSGRDFDILLEQMIACGELFKEGISKGELYPVSNIISTLRRIHNYQREQYPCGAGGGYMGVSAEGELYACHRFVNDDKGHMGDVQLGIDEAKQSDWLSKRNLTAQSACDSCWAKYMCSGSCHHEVIHRGRPACDYIRGWLNYCLGLYADLHASSPEILKGLLGDSEHAYSKIPLVDEGA